jgi:hypothetical protein
MLLKRNGDRRFVVLQGNHRLAVLAHLGVPQIAVRDVAGYVPVVRESEASRWPLVANGNCTAASALRIFNLFFESTGLEIGQRLRAAPSLTHAT